MRTDQPPARIEAAIARGGNMAPVQDPERADCYLGLIEGAPDGDFLRNWLRMLGRQVPIVMVTPAANLAPAWMLAQADMVFVMGANASLRTTATMAARWAEKLLKERPWVAKRRRN